MANLGSKAYQVELYMSTGAEEGAGLSWRNIASSRIRLAVFQSLWRTACILSTSMRQSSSIFDLSAFPGFTDLTSALGLTSNEHVPSGSKTNTFQSEGDRITRFKSPSLSGYASDAFVSDHQAQTDVLDLFALLHHREPGPWPEALIQSEKVDELALLADDIRKMYKEWLSRKPLAEVEAVYTKEAHFGCRLQVAFGRIGKEGRYVTVAFNMTLDDNGKNEDNQDTGCEVDRTRDEKLKTVLSSDTNSYLWTNALMETAWPSSRQSLFLNEDGSATWWKSGGIVPGSNDLEIYTMYGLVDTTRSALRPLDSAF